MEFTIYLQQQLDAERKIYSELPKHAAPIIIPRTVEKEEKAIEDDMTKFLAAYPQAALAIEQNKPITIQLTLSELNESVPHNRVRVDSYNRLVRLLRVKNIELVITSKRTKTSKFN